MKWQPLAGKRASPIWRRQDSFGTNRDKSTGLQSWMPLSLRAEVAAPYGTFGMDMTWVTGRIAVGGGIWTAENMAGVARAGVTHIVDMQIEFDDTALAAPHNIIVQWTATDDDFQPKPPEIFLRVVNFARYARDEEGN